MGHGHYLTEEEKQQTPKVTKALLARIFSYLKPYLPQLLLVLGCIAVSSICSLFPAGLTPRQAHRRGHDRRFHPGTCCGRGKARPRGG